MAKRNFSQKILVFYSDSFAFPCSFHSTAIVAPRGVSPGHSPLGDLLVEGYRVFKDHVKNDSPEGVIRVLQYTGAISKLEAFQKRYPSGSFTKTIGPFSLGEEFYFAEEEAYLIRPREYLDWLTKEASKKLNIDFIPAYVNEVNDKEIRTQDGKVFSADEIIFTAGIQNSLWHGLFSTQKKTVSVQGSYLEFKNVTSWSSSFSLTLEGDNLIFDKERGSLLLGSTTFESALELPPEKALYDIYLRLTRRMKGIPDWSEGKICVGIREKSSKREPYILKNGPLTMMGGFYKNGFTLGLSFAAKIADSE